ncbi:hypothetical protein SVIOM342S_05174 [Streptomyces violaceorubidus]
MAVLDGGLHLGEPVGAVREVVLDGALGVVQHRSVSRQDRVDAIVDGEGPEPAQGVEVVAEAAVGVGDDGRAAPQHGVAGEDRPVRRQMEAQGVRRVPRAGRPAAPGRPR